MIGFEMGHGDMIFYARYIGELKARGVRQVAMICHPGLKKLFTALKDVDQLYSLNDEVPHNGWDYWSAPMSLPHYCLTTPTNIPAPIPYLQADPALVDLWRAKLSGTGMRVGLVWKGNALFENDGERSISTLQTFAPFADISNIHFVGLQKGQGETESPPEGMSWQAIGMQLNDFADTAAVIHNLDLIISVDTAVAHLAGAMGKICWVLLPDFRCDWRWQVGEDTTPW